MNGTRLGTDQRLPFGRLSSRTASPDLNTKGVTQRLFADETGGLPALGNLFGEAHGQTLHRLDERIVVLVRM